MNFIIQMSCSSAMGAVVGVGHQDERTPGRRDGGLVFGHCRLDCYRLALSVARWAPSASIAPSEDAHRSEIERVGAMLTKLARR